MTRRRVLELLGWGGAGCAMYGVSRTKLLDFLYADADAFDGFTVMRRPYAPEPGRDISVLGYGGIRLPIKNRSKNQIDEKLGLALIDYAYRHGINYFDTAWGYHDGEGAKFIGRALKRYPRESFMLCNKMPPVPVRRAGDGARIFAEQLKRCQVDYFDTYLLHSVCDPAQYQFVYKELKTLDYLKAEREKGRIRHLGFSFHGRSDFLEQVLDDYPWELCLITVNAIYDRQVPDAARSIKLLQERHIPIFVMEPLGGGRCANLNEKAVRILSEARSDSTPAEWALRWALSHEGVQTVLSGMGRMTWLKENIRSLSAERFQPLTEAEKKTYALAIDAYMEHTTVPCTGCRYCLPCPYGVEIPEVFAWWNSFAGAGRLPTRAGENDSQELRREFLTSYARAIGPEGGPDRCVQCRKCKLACPQWVFDIPTEMRKIDDALVQVRSDYLQKGGRL